MSDVCGFSTELWEKLGFKFEVNDWFEGGQVWYAEKEFSGLVFSLRINTHTGYTLAKIENIERQKLGNHIVSEQDAIDWFSAKSEEFKKACEE